MFILFISMQGVDVAQFQVLFFVEKKNWRIVKVQMGWNQETAISLVLLMAEIPAPVDTVGSLDVYSH